MPGALQDACDLLALAVIDAVAQPDDLRRRGEIRVRDRVGRGAPVRQPGLRLKLARDAAGFSRIEKIDARDRACCGDDGDRASTARRPRQQSVEKAPPYIPVMR